MIVLALTASPAVAFDAQLGWTSMANMSGYRLYVRQNGQSYGVGTDTGFLPPDAGGVVRYVAHGLPSGVTNYFVVTTYDGSGHESAFSNELSLLVAATPTATSPAGAPTSTRTAPPVATATASRTATPIMPPTATVKATSTAVPATATRTSTAVATSTGVPATATRTVPPTIAATSTATPVATQTRLPSTTPTFTPTPIGAWRVSMSTTAHAKPGIAVDVPVRIAAGSGMSRLAVLVVYDPTVVAVQSAQLSDGAGTLAASFTTPGVLILTANLPQPMITGGPVVDVYFTAVGACGSATALSFTSCVLDGGALGCQPRDGHISVRCG